MDPARLMEANTGVNQSGVGGDMALCHPRPYQLSSEYTSWAKLAEWLPFVLYGQIINDSNFISTLACLLRYILFQPPVAAKTMQLLPGMLGVHYNYSPWILPTGIKARDPCEGISTNCHHPAGMFVQVDCVTNGPPVVLGCDTALPSSLFILGLKYLR